VKEEKEVELIIKGLTQGANIPLEQVLKEICPECSYRTVFCQSMIKLAEDVGGRCVCKGMRHWVKNTN
jgi:hypothetical protein